MTVVFQRVARFAVQARLDGETKAAKKLHGDGKEDNNNVGCIFCKMKYRV